MWEKDKKVNAICFGFTEVRGQRADKDSENVTKKMDNEIVPKTWQRDRLRIEIDRVKQSD